MNYNPEEELDPVTLASWSRLSVKELEDMRDKLNGRIDEMMRYSESLHNDSGGSLIKLERYIMYRKGNKDSGPMIL